MLPVSVILVTYNSADVIDTALASIEPGAEVIVVDNASSDGTLDRITRPDVVVIRSGENLGFGRGCNLGASRASREHLLFLNPDASLATGALAHLAAAAARHPECAAFNPRILNPDGRTFQRRMSRLLPPERNARLQSDLTGDQEVEMLTGAALFVRRRDFEAVGGFDDNIFLYFEDDDLALRLKGADRTLRHVHAAIVEHIGNASSGSSLETEAFKAYHLMKSRRYACRKHGRPFNGPYLTLQTGFKYLLAAATFNRRQQARLGGILSALLERA